jgi:NADH-quinone oxidoreductase subunit A
MPKEYYPMMLAFLVIIGILGAPLLFAARWLGPYNPSRIKNMPFECGNESEGSGRRRFSVKFYVVAILFVLFDLEVVFLYPYAIRAKDLGLYGLTIMAPFLSILVFGLVYEWKKGALEWE